MRVHKNGALNEKRPKNSAAQKQPRSGKVETTKIDRRVMREALKIAKGDARKLKINKDGSVEIRNK